MCASWRNVIARAPFSVLSGQFSVVSCQLVVVSWQIGMSAEECQCRWVVSVHAGAGARVGDACWGVVAFGRATGYPFAPCPFVPCPFVPCPLAPCPLAPCPLAPCPLAPCPSVPLSLCLSVSLSLSPSFCSRRLHIVMGLWGVVVAFDFDEFFDAGIVEPASSFGASGVEDEREAFADASAALVDAAAA